jgi:hypothetical protein
MNQNRDRDQWSTLVFRVDGLPNSTDSREDVATLLSQKLGDVTADSIHVFSLATTLYSWESSKPKVATVMFARPPGLLQSVDGDRWEIPSTNPDEHLILDTHFMGMTPLNDVDAARHVSE